MAHNVEPMDIDNIESDFDNKENSIHHSNVYPRTPCTEKGYEELDVSELNMKLRYSITPASSPMSKSFTANCIDNRNLESGDDNINSNLTRSLHSAISKGDVSGKSLKILPLQTISTEQFVDTNRNASVLRPLDTTTVIDNNVTITVSAGNDAYENMSLPSSSSSTAQTPKATTPTKDIPRSDGGSPIMRGLKSVLNMFRSSQSPIPLVDSADCAIKQVLSPADVAEITPDSSLQSAPSAVLASTPIAENKHKESNLSKRSSPLKESLVFNEDLEKELLWKDETTIFFSHEKIPIHKLFYQQGTSNVKETAKSTLAVDTDLNSTVEYMDISFNDSINRTITKLQAEPTHAESEPEFLDCETTFTNDKADNVNDTINYVNNESNLSSNVTEIVAAISAQNSSINTETVVKVAENLPVTELQQPDVIISVKETINIPQVKNEPATNHSEQENTLNTANNISDITQEISEAATSTSAENDGKIIKTNIKFESQTPLDATSDTPTLTAKASTEDNIVKETRPDIKNNELQVDMTFETSKVPTDVEILPTSINIPVLETSKLSEKSGTDPDLIILNTEINATLFEEKNVPVILDTTNKVVKNENNIIGPNENRIDDILDLPANIPLPDDEYIENEKSIGAVFLVEEGTVPYNLDIINTTATGLEYEINKDKAKEIEINVNKTPNVPDTIDCSATKKETRHIHKSEVKLEDNTAMNNTATFADILDNKEAQEQQISITESQRSQVLHEIVVLSDVIEKKTLTDDAKGIQSNVEVETANIEEIQQRQVSPKSNFTVKATPSISQDICDLHQDSHTVKNEKDLTTQTIMPEISDMKENTFTKEHIAVNDISIENVENKDEEISLSENNSPFVSLSGQIDQDPEQANPKEIQNPFATKSEIVLTPPSSPKIVSKGYNFNFDDIDDPFATKTKIRISPTPDTPEKLLKEVDTTFTERSPQRDVNKNRRKSQSDRKKSMPKKKINSTFCGSVNVTKGTSNNKLEVIKYKPDTIDECNRTVDNKYIHSQPLQDVACDLELSSPIQIDTVNIGIPMTENSPHTMSQESTNKDIAKEENSVDVRDIDTTMEYSMSENKSSVVSLNAISNETKNTSSSEQSTYYSAGTSSGEGVESRNVFNLPEIDDINFNPFITKSKMRQSPPPNLNASAALNFTQDLACSLDTASKSQSDATFTEHPFETKSKMRQSPPLSLNVTATLNDLQELPTSLDTVSKFKSDATFTENPFETKSKMRQSSPLSLNETATLNTTQERPIPFDTVSKFKSDATFTEDPFETKSKMCTSPPPSLNATTTLNATQKLPSYSDTASKSKSDATFTEVNTGDFDFNKDFETKAFSTFDDKEYENISNTTCSSKATDEKDLTVREVHTEDEDTIEGPFLEEFSNEDKMSDFDGDDVDMMQFSELPVQNTEENVDGELFIDAEAFEFLLNQNKSNVVTDSGKESLFLKFDPLFAKRMSSDGVLAALNKKRQSTPKKMSTPLHMDVTFDKSIAGPSTLNTTHEVASSITAAESTDDFNVTVSKPMMVVTPAVNPIVTPRIRTSTPPSSNRRSITFTSPAIAVIDRLLSLSANNSLVGHDTTFTHMSREQNEADLALTQLRELLAEKEINVYNLRTESKELKDRLSSMESQMRILESEGQDRLKKINNLNEKLSEKTKHNKSMAGVVEEYERTIAYLIADTEQDKKRNNEERIRLIKERDEQRAHLASMEVSFSDLHSKYEKCKQIILSCKANEDAYLKSIKEFEENLTKMQSNYELLKQHATSKLNHANQELEKMNRSHETEVLKLNAMIKRKDLHITSLEETLAQKTKANEELTAICDELINKVG